MLLVWQNFKVWTEIFRRFWPNGHFNGTVLNEAKLPKLKLALTYIGSWNSLQPVIPVKLFAASYTSQKDFNSACFDL